MPRPSDELACHQDELGGLPREEKPWIRDLAGRLVTFCRAADRAQDVLFAWSLH